MAIIEGVWRQLGGTITRQSTLHSIPMHYTQYTRHLMQMISNGCPPTTIFDILLPLIHPINTILGVDDGAN